MTCSACGSPTVHFAVPADSRSVLSTAGSVSVADDHTHTLDSCTFCTHCLVLEFDDDAEAASPTTDGSTAPDFSRVSDAFPTTPEQAVPLALAIGLAESLAMNRSAIETFLRDVERAGADPLLVLDRLQRDPSVEPAIDLERRQHQFEQVLY
ncbi:uncharacterized protein Nmag_1365 [Natrialba magadii ATCC 43099]|uniref:Small CPxCG-related zinc finger protein n=1 Tax=Natrialba magadii (strain ATCC 43099 / DSM 3394 / CCM 3739 / CIP 104546 / IAM 13178 / JCM 8861 / NBRC 102185 / NCIMB 2190 / MS3) TaxID=547559 RepID=D3SSZ8_NATMM|nr:DUF6276 family protein [Natrialba magadii]ADD04944.1 uncharacterized protein Nmag_1365 [Natrialba magadii ATCC 43099]ELY23992.1 hypothetical protein C500_19350 [Natrialba magadii ATCC 43099]